jgi:multicomponent Na+:H+ antiporter subunit A
VFWELTTITSYLLIGFDHATYKSRRSALQALLLTGTGALALLAGFILIGTVAGTFELSEIREQGDVLKEHALYLPILILILAGTFTKSAQFPFHFWLPNAMAAPTPVSAYLHSATMVKAGIYLMARMHPNLGGTEVWLWTLTIFGAVTAVFASFMALKQTDLKQTLAYTTLMALGTLTMLLGDSTSLCDHRGRDLPHRAFALQGGAVPDHRRGGPRHRHARGRHPGRARPAMPVTAAAAALAALSMAGLPPFIGFIAKEVMYVARWARSRAGLRDGAALACERAHVRGGGDRGLQAVLAAGPARRPSIRTRGRGGCWQGRSSWRAAGADLRALPGDLRLGAVNPAVAAILGPEVKPAELKLWAGVNLPLGLSIATFALGFVLYIHGSAPRRSIAGDRARASTGAGTA